MKLHLFRCPVHGMLTEGATVTYDRPVQGDARVGDRVESELVTQDPRRCQVYIGYDDECFLEVDDLGEFEVTGLEP